MFSTVGARFSAVVNADTGTENPLVPRTRTHESAAAGRADRRAVQLVVMHDPDIGRLRCGGSERERVLRMNHRTRRCAFVMVALGLAVTVAACGDDTDQLPAYESLEATYQAVDEVVDCSEEAPAPPEKRLPSGGPTGESLMCTNTVEVLWFDTAEARDDVYGLLASAAGSAGSVYFVEGRNWFVADFSEVGVGTVPERTIDMEGLAHALGARYTAEQ